MLHTHTHTYIYIYIFIHNMHCTYMVCLIKSILSIIDVFIFSYLWLWWSQWTSILGAETSETTSQFCVSSSPSLFLYLADCNHFTAEPPRISLFKLVNCDPSAIQPDIQWYTDSDAVDMSKDLKGSCRNLVLRGPMMENVAQTMESDMVNYLKR